MFMVRTPWVQSLLAASLACSAGSAAAMQKTEPCKAFDNACCVGICWVSAWLITSPQGHVLVDALYRPDTTAMLGNIRLQAFETLGLIAKKAN